MANIVLIAGTHHGGWYWDGLAAELRNLGHRTFAPSLSGLDDEFLFTGAINLDTHIDDVLKIIESNRLQSLVLVGSSYGGMVITGVADRTTAEIEGLIYLDADVPLPGQSEWDLTSGELLEKFIHSTKDGIYIDVPEEFLAIRPRLMPHPFATKLQPLIYSSEKFKTFQKIYVHAELGFGPDLRHFFLDIYQRIQTESDWITYSLPVGHDVATEAPDDVIEIIDRHSSRSI
jgi:pimeloyl-ACP methyl ester carboxylesterase